MAIIRNMAHETALPLKEQIAWQKGQVVSKTLVQNSGVGMTLFAFAAGEGISAHDSAGDAFVQVLDGVGRFTVGGKEHTLKAGDALVMPARIPHAVYAPQDFKMLLTVVFPADDRHD